MNRIQQGVTPHSKVTATLARVLLLFTFALPQNIVADTVSNETALIKNNSKPHNIQLIYSADSDLQSTIAQVIAANLNQTDGNIHLTQLTPAGSNDISHEKPELIIAIGSDSIEYADVYYNKTDALLIASNPGEYTSNAKTGNNRAVLYMSQPYCKQIHLIKEINPHWKTISYLNNKEKPVDDGAIKKCANKYKMDTHKVDTTRNGTLSNEIKDALDNSDLLLALPDNTIYNSKSVKNILLTSYRNRKPVIGFSKNFVSAGALASIHSDAEQIADSATELINQYYRHDKTFRTRDNYPLSFEVSINKQVFRALNLHAPDIEKIKQTLMQPNAKRTRQLQ